jgi:hypothetical protein
MADVVYNGFKNKIMDGSINLESDTIKVALVTSSYTPDIDAHHNFDDITNEVTGTGYSAGGATISNIAVTTDDTNDEGKVDGDDVTWSTSTITARGAVVYKSVATATQSWLICYFDFTADKSSSAGDFKIQWHADGILNLG